MVEFVVHLVLTAALLLIVSRAVQGVEIEGWGPAILGALVLGLVNAFVWPVMVILTLPITVLTFGLFLLVINALMLWLMAAIVPGVHVRSFAPALWGSLVLALLNILVRMLLGPGWTA